jgi:hypothetical protein
MKESNKTVVGLDIHKESIVTGVLPAWSEGVTESIWIQNTKEALEKMVKRLGKKKTELEFVYEAGHSASACKIFTTTGICIPWR